jgi:hypothetical protein
MKSCRDRLAALVVALGVVLFLASTAFAERWPPVVDAAVLRNAAVGASATYRLLQPGRSRVIETKVQVAVLGQTASETVLSVISDPGPRQVVFTFRFEKKLADTLQYLSGSMKVGTEAVQPLVAPDPSYLPRPQTRKQLGRSLGRQDFVFQGKTISCQRYRQGNYEMSMSAEAGPLGVARLVDKAGQSWEWIAN